MQERVSNFYRRLFDNSENKKIIGAQIPSPGIRKAQTVGSEKKKLASVKEKMRTHPEPAPMTAHRKR